MKDRPTGHRRVALLTVLASVVFGAVVGVAVAQRHYHEISGVHHGFVHGVDTRDNHYTARVDSPYANHNYCVVGDAEAGFYHTFHHVTYGTDRCDDYNRDHYRAWWHECRGIAGVDQDGQLNGHTHLSHNYYAEPCKVWNA